MNGHSHSHSHSSEPESPIDAHSHSHSSGHEHSHSSSHSHSHSTNFPQFIAHSPVKAGNGNSSPTRRHFRGASLSLHEPEADDDGLDMPPIPTSKLLQIRASDSESPLTPNYKFVHDEHLSAHHHSGHSHSSGAHEGHSHNMRGVFLHVMAVYSSSSHSLLSTSHIYYL
jgi:solute carrier family 30 (zinc transporter), member 5/7